MPGIDSQQTTGGSSALAPRGCAPRRTAAQLSGHTPSARHCPRSQRPTATARQESDCQRANSIAISRRSPATTRLPPRRSCQSISQAHAALYHDSDARSCRAGSSARPASQPGAGHDLRSSPTSSATYQRPRRPAPAAPTRAPTTSGLRGHRGAPARREGRRQRRSTWSRCHPVTITASTDTRRWALVQRHRLRRNGQHYHTRAQECPSTAEVRRSRVAGICPRRSPRTATPSCSSHQSPSHAPQRHSSASIAATIHRDAAVHSCSSDGSGVDSDEQVRSIAGCRQLIGHEAPPIPAAPKTYPPAAPRA